MGEVEWKPELTEMRLESTGLDLNAFFRVSGHSGAYKWHLQEQLFY